MNLVEAAARGDLVAVTAQVAQGIDVNTQDADGRTPLSWAAGLGYEAIVEFLLSQSGVEPGLADTDGRTPFSWAAGNGCEEVVEQLLRQSGIKPDSEDAVGRTPFSWAAGNGHQWVTRILISAKMPADTQDKNGRTPLSWAAGNGHHLVVEDLLNGEKVRNDFADLENRTPLSWAAGNGHDKAVRALLQIAGTYQYRGARIAADSRDSNGRTPLSWAARNGHDNVANILTGDNEVDINATDYEGLSLMLHAVKHGHSAVVESLLGRTGIDMNFADTLGQTALHYAARWNHVAIVRELLTRREVSVDAKDIGGITPLGKAVQYNATQSIQSLLQSSASTEGIMRDDWLDAFCKPSSCIVLLSEISGGIKSIRFIAEECLSTALSSSTQKRHLFLFRDFSPWDRQLIPNSISGQDAAFEWRTQHTTGSNAVTSFVAQIPAINRPRKYLQLEWHQCAIAWDMAHQGNSTVPLNYFSMLPYSVFPKSAATLFEQLLCHLRETWLRVCAECELYLADQRQDQLHKKGESADLIDDLARDAQVWSSMRYHLRKQVYNMRKFTEDYLRFNKIDHNKAQTLGAIAEFEAVVQERVNSLDQALRDLLQFEFAWVSINEARRSIDLAASIKRLTWITFIFLPLMFSSSLFGMNVDLLKDNPDWRWYALFAGVSLALTTCGWLVVRSDLLKRILKGVSRDKVPGVESKTTLPR